MTNALTIDLMENRFVAFLIATVENKKIFFKLNPIYNKLAKSKCKIESDTFFEYRCTISNPITK